MAGVFLAASARLFVWPPSDEPKPVDAVVALAGGHGQRLAVAREVVAEHPATLVLSVGEDDAVDALCADPAGLDVRCFAAEPFRTSGEARAFGALAREHGWDSVAVVTSTSHLTRARVLVSQCVDARVSMIDAGRTGSNGVVGLVREWGGLVGAFTFDRAC